MGDAEKRKKYDQFGEWADQGGFDPRRQAYQSYTWKGGQPGGGSGPADFDVGDIFENIFGNMGGTRRGRTVGRGSPFGSRFEQEEELQRQDVSATMDIGFEEAIKGTARRVSISRNGREEKIDVKIPAGIRDGGKIRLTGKGDRGGDLYIKVNVAPHPLFKRVEDDLYLEVPIPFTAAALGGTIKVPTLDKAVNLKIPPGTSSGQKFRLSGKGAPRLGTSGHGDQYVVIKIVIPEDVLRDEESKEALRKIHAKIPQNPNG